MIKLNTIEEFKDLKDYYYFNTDDLNIYSCAYKEIRKLKPVICNGYSTYSLSTIHNKYPRISQHRIVAHFMVKGFSEINNVVNHKDEDKLNNSPDNLEWITQRDNSRYSLAKHPIAYVNGVRIREFISSHDAANEAMVSHTHVIAAINGRQKTAGVYDVSINKFVKRDTNSNKDLEKRNIYPVIWSYE